MQTLFTENILRAVQKLIQCPNAVHVLINKGDAMKKAIDILLIVSFTVMVYLVGSTLGRQKLQDDIQAAIESHYDYERMVCE